MKINMIMDSMLKQELLLLQITTQIKLVVQVLLAHTILSSKIKTVTQLLKENNLL
jgi:hypothetical protein